MGWGLSVCLSTYLAVHLAFCLTFFFFLSLCLNFLYLSLFLAIYPPS